MSVRVASRQLPDVRAGGVSEGRTHPRLRRSVAERCLVSSVERPVAAEVALTSQSRSRLWNGSGFLVGELEAAWGLPRSFPEDLMIVPRVVSVGSVSCYRHCRHCRVLVFLSRVLW